MGAQDMVVVDATYGLEDAKVTHIRDAFSSVLTRMQELAAECARVALLEPCVDSCVQARELRLKLVKIRTTTAGIHKQLKAGILAEGKYIDAWKNAQEAVSASMEERLASVEKHYERQEAARIAEIQALRVQAIQSYGPEFVHEKLGVMEDAMWENYLAGAKASYEQRMAREKEAAALAAESARKAAEERERLRAENEALRKAAEEKERAEAKEREAQKKAEAVRKAFADMEHKKQEEAAQKERVAREKAEAELRAQKAAEAERAAKELSEKLAREKKERDAQHRMRIESEAAGDIELLCLTTAVDIVNAISEGHVRHVRMVYA